MEGVRSRLLDEICTAEAQVFDAAIAAGAPP